MAISSGKKIEIVIELDNKGAVKSVKELENAIKGAGKETEKTGEIFGKLGQAVGIGAAIFAIKKLASTVSELAEEGAKIDGLTRSFQDLQASVGSNGTEALNKLKVATSGLINNFELMRLSNQAVLLGLPTEGFDKMAEAATKLGIATGRTANEALQDLITGVGRASPLILDNLGILVDTEAAYQKYADSIGVATEKLTEQQKTLAFQAEAYDKINQKAKELTGLQLDAGASSQQFGASLENLRGRIASTLNQNTDLALSLQNLASTFDNIDATMAVNALATFSSAIIDLIALMAEVTASAANFFGGIFGQASGMQLSETMNALNQQTQDALNNTKAWVGEIKQLGNEKGLIELAPALQAASNQSKELNKDFTNQTAKVGELQNKLAALNKEIAGGATGQGPARNVLQKQIDDAQKALLPLAENVELVNKKFGLLKSAEEQLKRLPAPIRKTKEETDDAKKKADELAKAWERLNDQVSDLTGTTGLEKYEAQLRDLFDQQAKGVISSEELRKQIIGIAEAAKLGEKELGTYADKVRDAAQESKKAAEEIARANEQLAEDQKRKIESVQSGVESAIANNIRDALTALTEGGSFDAVLKQTSAQIGAAMGSYFGPIGAAVGELIGEQIGEGLGKLGEGSKSTWEGIGQIFLPAQGVFGNPVGKLLGKAFGGREDEAANARDAFENYIIDVLDEKKLQLVIDGQLQKLDFHITGGRDAFDGGALFGAFDGMSGDNIAAFSGIGDAMAGLMGITEDLGSQFGAILADNVGNLNNLQILINQLGFSAEQMQEQVKNAWLAGDSSAQEALSTLQAINQVTTQGIPDGLGMLSTAFDNLAASGGSGNIVLDALGDIAVEAKEKGIDSLAGAMQDLIASGVDAKKVAEVFTAIKNAGITSLEELKNVSVEKGIEISAALENTPDFFAEKIEKLEDIKNKLREIESKEVDIKFNFKSTVDQNTQNAISAGAFTSAGIPNIGSEGI